MASREFRLSYIIFLGCVEEAKNLDIRRTFGEGKPDTLALSEMKLRVKGKYGFKELEVLH